MGWKLCGIAINKNFSDDKESLFQLLGINNHTFLKESSFDNETINMLEDDELAIGFFGKGTLLFTGVELMTNDDVLSKSSIGLSILAFYIYEVSSTYCFDFYHNGDYKRKYWISLVDKGIDQSDNFGEPLKEESGNDYLESIFQIISSLLGENFYSINEDDPMLKFSIKPEIQELELLQKKGFWKRLFG